MKYKREKIKISIYIIIALLAAFIPLHTITGNGVEWLWGYLIPILFLYNITTLVSEHRYIQQDKLSLLLVALAIYMIARDFIPGDYDYKITIIIFFLTLFLNFRQWTIYNHIIPYLFIGIAVIESIWGISQSLGLIYNPMKNGVVGSFYGPVALGACLVATAPLCVILLKDKDKQKRIIGIVSLLIILVGIVLSGSRAAVISVVVVSLLYLYSIIKRNKTKYLFIFGTFTTALLAALFFINIESVYGRLLIWRVSLNMIMDNPIFGKGVFGFSSEYMKYQADYFMENTDSIFASLADNVSFTFNEYLSIFIGYGILGIILLLLIIGYIVINNSKDNPHLLSLISLMVFSLFSYPTHYPLIIIIIAYAISQLPNNHKVYDRKKTFYFDLFSKNFNNRYERDYKPLVAVSLFMIWSMMSATVFFKRVYMGRWDDAISHSYFEMTPKVMEEYDSLYVKLNDEPKFLYNYGIQLSRNGDYKKSIEIMKESSEYLSDYNLNMSLADSYLNTKQYNLAKEYYKFASNMIPNRFIPLDCLLYTYDILGEKQKALEMAEIIVAKKVKVPSLEVSGIKKRAKGYIISGIYDN